MTYKPKTTGQCAPGYRWMGWPARRCYRRTDLGPILLTPDIEAGVVETVGRAPGETTKEAIARGRAERLPTVSAEDAVGLVFPRNARGETPAEAFQRMAAERQVRETAQGITSEEALRQMAEEERVRQAYAQGSPTTLAPIGVKAKPGLLWTLIPLALMARKFL